MIMSDMFRRENNDPGFHHSVDDLCSWRCAGSARPILVRLEHIRQIPGVDRVVSALYDVAMLQFHACF